MPNQFKYEGKGKEKMRNFGIKKQAKATAKNVGGKVLIGGVAVVAYAGVAVVATSIYMMEAATGAVRLVRSVAR